MSQLSYVKSFIPYILFLALGFVLFPSTGGDDPYITYWSAHSLSEFGEILNYNGDRVEQSSSLLHTIILAVLHRISNINIETLSPMLTILSGVITIYLAGVLSELFEVNKFAVKILTATSIPLLYWSFSGLETSLIGVCTLMVVITYLKAIERPTKTNIYLVLLSISAYILLRPEAFFVTGLFLFLSLLAQYLNKDNIKTTFFISLYTLIFFTALSLFRYAYFDAFFPQPVYAKVGMSLLAKITDGYHYYQKAIREYPVFILLFLPIVLFLLNILRTKNEKILYMYLFTISYLLFIFTSGGDWMGGLRFFAPIVSILFVIAIKQYGSYFSTKKIIIIGLVANLYYLGTHVATKSTSIFIANYFVYKNKLIDQGINADQYSFFEIANKVHYRDIPTSTNLNQLMKKILEIEPNPSVMSGQAGFVLYHLGKKYYKKFTFLDRYGLSTRELTQCSTTKDRTKNAWGLIVRYNYFFNNIEKISNNCNIDKPDIIFDVDWKMNKDVLKYGYKIIYFQKGLLTYGMEPKGKSSGATQFIAVKPEIFKKLNLKKIKYEF